MLKAIDLAKFFIKQDPSSFENTFDGNMKLQKLLFFAFMTHLTLYNEPLFNDKIRAYSKGCVVESVREHYRLSYQDLINESDAFEDNFSKNQYESIRKTNEIFGKLPAKTLSELSHDFKFWEEHYHQSKKSDGTYDQNKNIISISEMLNEKERMLKLLTVKPTISEKENTINGIRFIFDSDIELSKDLYDYLYEFSNSDEADDDTYSVYLDNNEWVVY